MAVRMQNIKSCHVNADASHNFQLTPHDGMLLMHCTHCGKTAILTTLTHRITQKPIGAFWQLMDFAMPTEEGEGK